MTTDDEPMPDYPEELRHLLGRLEAQVEGIQRNYHRDRMRLDPQQQESCDFFFTAFRFFQNQLANHPTGRPGGDADDQDDLDEQAFQAQEDAERKRIYDEADDRWQEDIEELERENYVLGEVSRWDQGSDIRREAFMARLAEQRDLQE